MTRKGKEKEQRVSGKRTCVKGGRGKHGRRGKNNGKEGGKQLDGKEKETKNRRRDAPVMISTSSFVMAAWRPRLYCIWRVPIMSLAFLDALSMAFRRALCSHACPSTSAAKSALARENSARSRVALSSFS
jgi:hypothetical protein